MAQGVAVMVLAGWLWIVAEPVIRRVSDRLSRGRIPAHWLRMVTQSLHQETLFFSLPFVLAATVWGSSQILFALLVLGAALVTTLDGIYHRYVGDRLGGMFAFQAFCAFVAALVVVPLALHQNTERALTLAALLAVASLLPALMLHVLATPWRRWPRGLLLLSLALGTAWLLQPAVPLVGLKVQALQLTQAVSAEREPGPALQSVSATTLHSEGLVAFAAIRAPLGLDEDLYFDWHFEGERIDRIITSIHGGREAGYRTYTRKQNFPAESAGRWRIELRSQDGRLLGRTTFVVHPDNSAADGGTSSLR